MLPSELPYSKRADYVRGLIPLCLFYAWHRAQPGAPLADILNRQTHIYRLTSLWKGDSGAVQVVPASRNTRWKELLKEIEKIDRQCTNVKDFEGEAFRLLWPLAEQAIGRDVADWPWIPEGYCTRRLPGCQISGCFAWESASEPATVSIHIANACMPQSPFNNLQHRIIELKAMVSRLKDSVPKHRYIKCNSWLNSFPPFLKLFPANWPRSQNVSAVGASCNWWGQFMARDGTFHRRHGEFLRSHMRFPWPAIDGICTINELEAHLHEFLR